MCIGSAGGYVGCSLATKLILLFTRGDRPMGSGNSSQDQSKVIQAIKSLCVVFLLKHDFSLRNHATIEYKYDVYHEY